MIRRLLIGLILLALNTHHAEAIQAIVSHTTFYLPDSGTAAVTRPYIEAYWQIDPVSVHFMRTSESKLISAIRTDIEISNENGIISQKHFILKTPPRNSSDEVLAHTIMDLHRFVVSPGHITLHLKLTDMTDSTNNFNYTDTLTITATNGTAIYSGIQLLDTVIASDVNTSFVKNNQQQIPFCTNYYDERRNILHYYIELYNTAQLFNNDYPLIQRAFISKREGEGIYPKLMATDTIKLGRQVMPVLGSFPLVSLGSGNYYLNVSLQNSTGQILSTSAILLQRYNLHPAVDTQTHVDSLKYDNDIEKVTVLNLNKTFLSKYSLPQIKAIVKMLLPVSDAADAQAIKNFSKKPDDMYMRYFIYNHFVGINKDDPEKAWNEYADKVKVVNKLFSLTGTPGYTTDRGFVYLRYGKPDEQITVENESGTLPYEIWQYNSLRLANNKSVTNAVFLFYRPSEMIAGYQLLQSTVPGELQNSAWRTYLYTSGSSLGNNSRAEQYLGKR